MVIAIFNGLNKPENCHLYRQKRIEREQGQIADLTLSLDTEIRKARTELAGVQEMEVINDVASKTNLLSMNAAIEAAHAGDSGRGFAVVAAEIRKLAETTAENAKHISATLTGMADQINTTAKITQNTGTVIHGMIQDIGGVASSITELIDSLHEMSVGSSEITTALSALRDMSIEVREACRKMEGAAAAVESTMTRIGSLSRENLRRIGGNEGKEIAAASSA